MDINRLDINTRDYNTTGKGVFVARSEKKPDGKRLWDKKHVCLYCLKQYSKLARHLQQVHSKELEVQRALSYNTSSKKRKEAWKNLMCKGDFAHNIKVFEEGSGESIPCKRPRIEKEGTCYVQCKQCLCTYLSSDLWRHDKKAHPENKPTTKSKYHHQIESASLMPVSNAANQKFREKILDKMANDDVSLIARTDYDIVVFGQRKFLKYARNIHQYNHIRKQMRELARFVQSARKTDSSIVSLRNCVHPQKFDTCVRAVKSLCCFNESTQLYGIPSLAKKIGHSLHKVAVKVKTDAMAKGDKQL